MAEITRKELALALIAAGDHPRLAGMDLSGLNMRSFDLHGADLSEANLSGADLRGANLYKAVLRGVDLRGAHHPDGHGDSVRL